MIQRYEPRIEGGRPYMSPCEWGGFVHYAELAWCQHQYRMSRIINIVLVVAACGILAALLVTWKASHGPTPVPTTAQRHADEQIELAEAQHQARKAEVDTLTRNLDQVSGKLDGALQLNDNLKVKIQELNTLTDPAQQVDTLKVAAAQMHDGQVAALAREMGFSKIRVVE